MKSLKSSLFSKFENSKLASISAIYGGIEGYTSWSSGSCDVIEGRTIRETSCASVRQGGDSVPTSDLQ